MDNIIFVFSHYDDEFGLFNIIENSVKKEKNVYVLYLTNGLSKGENNNKKLIQRENESINVLIKLGVNRKRIIFLGKRLNIPVYNLHKKLNTVYKNINNFLKKIKGSYIIYTHAWEGGNEDHDSCFILVKKILLNNMRVKKCLQFSQYHRFNTTFYPFKVQSFIPSNSKIFYCKISFSQKIKYILYLFTYTSQFYLWLPLYPFIILKILFNKYGNVKNISKNLYLKKPHVGNLLYENLRNNKYKDLKIYFFKLLKTKKYQNPKK